MYRFLYCVILLNYFTVDLQGSIKDCSPVFLLKGKDLFLEIKTQKPKDQFSWKLNNTYIIVRHDPEGKTRYFKERTEFSTEDYSVRIKNLGLNESGLYQAIQSSSKEVIVDEYCVTVQEHVSPVVLKVSSVSPSPESCNVNVTCSTQSSSLTSTFTCTNQTCSEGGGDPPEVVTSDVLLHIYLWNDSLVLCNHSNKVSWSNNTMEIKHLCHKIPGIDELYDQRQKFIIITVCRLVLFIPLVMLLIWYCKKEKNHRTEKLKIHSEQTPHCDRGEAIYNNVGLLEPPTQPLELVDMELKPRTA